MRRGETYPARVADDGNDDGRDRRGEYNEEDQEIVPPAEAELTLLDVGPAPCEARRLLCLLICCGLLVLRKTHAAEAMPVESRVVEGDATESRDGGYGVHGPGEYASLHVRRGIGGRCGLRRMSGGQESVGLC